MYSVANYVHRINPHSWPTYPQRDLIINRTRLPMDNFGLFEVKLLRTSLKRWRCLFTCLTTRAVHIEVVRSLDTDSCLLAINRLIARRGKPTTIISLDPRES